MHYLAIFFRWWAAALAFDGILFVALVAGVIVFFTGRRILRAIPRLEPRARARAVWRWFALGCTPHKTAGYKRPGRFWGEYVHGCDVPDSCRRDCPHLLRRLKYQRQDLARVLPRARLARLP